VPLADLTGRFVQSDRNAVHNQEGAPIGRASRRSVVATEPIATSASVCMGSAEVAKTRGEPTDGDSKRAVAGLWTIEARPCIRTDFGEARELVELPGSIEVF
jgi:hypothetical protein